MWSLLRKCDLQTCHLFFCSHRQKQCKGDPKNKRGCCQRPLHSRQAIPYMGWKPLRALLRRCGGGGSHRRHSLILGGMARATRSIRALQNALYRCPSDGLSLCSPPPLPRLQMFWCLFPATPFDAPRRGPQREPRYTVCVSSQVGCAMNCQFCYTGRLGLMANLQTAQVCWAPV